MMDLVLTINIILEYLEPTEEMLLAADVNEDGMVNVQDLVQIVELILR